MYAKEYKNWILHKNAVPSIGETINSFKEYWANAIALVNQTAVPASQHGYRMTAMGNDASVAAYDDSLANFGACRMPLINVPYKRTFGAPDQGQTLDV
jgi:hypothetical protein